MDKPLIVQYFSLDCPEATKALMVALSWKTIKVKQQTSKLYDFKKVHIEPRGNVNELFVHVLSIGCARPCVSKRELVAV